MRRLGMQGLLLGVLLFFGAPAGESFIVNVLHLWHYGAPLSVILPGSGSVSHMFTSTLFTTGSKTEVTAALVKLPGTPMSCTAPSSR